MKAIITVDLGYGDSGKGTIVDSLVQRHNSKLVVRYNGGFQAAHNVHQGNTHHTFSQFGSGTFSGAKTLLGPDVIVNPLTMQVEADVLVSKGITNPLGLVIVSDRCLITTPYHKALNQVRELSRKVKHGSTGVGIGETRRMWFSHPHLNLNVGWVSYNSSLEKLKAVMEHCYMQCQELIHDYGISGPQIDAAMEIFEWDSMLTIYQRYVDWADKITIVDDTKLRVGLGMNEVVIFEAAHGILLDQKHGFHPYTTWADTTVSKALILAYRASNSQELIGITRTYAVRHGAGPLVTESAECDELIEDDDNPHGQFQGSIRVGHLDLMTLKYAVKLLPKLDGLAITHCDKLSNQQAKMICVGYKGADLSNYNCEIEAGRKAMEFTQAYLNTKPIIEGFGDPVAFVSKQLNVPVMITSHSKQTKDKTYYGKTN